MISGVLMLFFNEFFQLAMFFVFISIRDYRAYSLNISPIVMQTPRTNVGLYLISGYAILESNYNKFLHLKVVFNKNNFLLFPYSFLKTYIFL